MKKILSLLIALSMTVTLFTFTSCRKKETTIIEETVSTTEKKVDFKGEDGFSFEMLKDGTLKLIDADKTAENVVVPKKFKQLTVSAIGKSAFKMSKAVSITLPETINTIESYSFALSTKLKNINIPEGVKVLGNNAFTGCFSLSKITLPESLEKIEIFAFDGSGLTEIIIPKNVKKIEQYSFAECDKLKIIEFKGKDVDIESNVFNRTSKVIIYAPKNSSAIKLAKSQGINYKEL